MNYYLVTVPITGNISMFVRAASEEEAEERALSQEYGDRQDESNFDEDAKENVTWELCRKIVEGNVFHGEQNEISVSKQKEPS